jgi:hypothetical protein
MNSSTPDLGDDRAKLQTALLRWCDALDAFRITATEDRPEPRDSALADRMADAADEVIGWLREAHAGLQSGEAAEKTGRLVGLAILRQGKALFDPTIHMQLDWLSRSGGPGWQAWVHACHLATEPLWSCAEEAVRFLVSPPGSMIPPKPETHTTVFNTSFTKTDSK